MNFLYVFGVVAMFLLIVLLTPILIVPVILSIWIIPILMMFRWSWARQVGIGWDQLANTYIGGYADETISSRCAKRKDWLGRFM